MGVSHYGLASSERSCENESRGGPKKEKNGAIFHGDDLAKHRTRIDNKLSVECG